MWTMGSTGVLKNAKLQLLVSLSSVSKVTHTEILTQTLRNKTLQRAHDYIMNNKGHVSVSNKYPFTCKQGLSRQGA